MGARVGRRRRAVLDQVSDRAPAFLTRGDLVALALRRRAHDQVLQQPLVGDRVGQGLDLRGKEGLAGVQLGRPDLAMGGVGVARRQAGDIAALGPVQGGELLHADVGDLEAVDQPSRLHQLHRLLDVALVAPAGGPAEGGEVEGAAPVPQGPQDRSVLQRQVEQLDRRTACAGVRHGWPPVASR